MLRQYFEGEDHITDWQWHYEKIGLLKYFIQECSKENSLRKTAISALASYYERENPRELQIKLYQTAWELSRNEDEAVKNLFEGHVQKMEGDVTFQLNVQPSVGLSALDREISAFWQKIKLERKEIDQKLIIESRGEICKFNDPKDTFVGRKRLIKQIKQALTKDTRGRTKAVVLSGLGGVGKTQLASKFIVKYLKNYHSVWTFNAESEDRLNADYRIFAEKLGFLIEPKMSEEEVLKKVNDWLEAPEHQGWLLYFDNADDPEFLEQKFPQFGGQILITARQRDGWEKSVVIPIQGLEREESIALLKKLITKEHKRGNDASLSALAEKLGDLPLALTQAARLIDKDKGILNIDRYVGYFDEEWGKIWGRERPPFGYPDTVATTWKMNIARVREKSADAVEVFNFCAYLDPDRIATTWLVNWLKEEKQVPEGFDFDYRLGSLIAPLVNFGLFEEELGKKGESKEHGLCMHRLVQLVVRDSLSLEEKRGSIQQALRLVEREFAGYKEDQPNTWVVGQHCLAHALRVAKHAQVMEGLEVADKEKAAALYCKAGSYVKKQGDLFRARGYCEEALRIREAIYEENNVLISDALICLGDVESGLGHKKKAIEDYGRALKIYSELGIYQEENSTYGEEHLGVARLLTSFGNTLREHEFGRRDKAKEYLEQAVRIFETVWGESRPEITYPLVGLGNTLRALGQHEEAEKCLIRALQIRERVYGKKHSEVAYPLIGLGNMSVDLGRHGEAKKYFEQALAIRKECYGENHPEVALLLENIGNVLRKWGNVYKGNRKYKEALEKYDEAINEYYSLARSIYEGIPGLDETHRGAFYLEMNLKEALDAKEELETLLNTPEKRKCVIS